MQGTSTYYSVNIVNYLSITGKRLDQVNVYLGQLQSVFQKKNAKQMQVGKMKYGDLNEFLDRLIKWYRQGASSLGESRRSI